MGLFDNILKDEESLFTDELILDFEYLPDTITGRDKEKKYIATCIQPLLQNRNGKNIIITGKPGIGKTASMRHIFQEIQKETENTIPIYVNCFKKDTPYKIALEICHNLGYKFTHNKTTEDLIKEVTKILNKKAAVFCFDEIDKLEDTSILYILLEDIYKKTIILITNYKEWSAKLDQRIKSRLMPETLEFKPYNYEETKEILKQRIESAFVQNVFQQKAIDLITEKTSELEDIRTGLHLLREAGNLAEMQAKRTIKVEHAIKAIEKIKDFNLPNLNQKEQEVLNLIKENSGKTIKDIYEIYNQKEPLSYRTFARRLENLEKYKFITKKETSIDGLRSTLVEFKK